ncbi:MAG: SxtJ family membrane protein [Candidatus Omnitrophota bacterium]|jgi:hypothetical protein
MNKELRKFGLSLGLGLNILGWVLFYRQREYFIWFTAAGSAVFIMAILFPAILTPLKKILDRIILFIGWLTSVISFSMVFYLIFTPVAFIFKLSGKDLLDRKIDNRAGSYWIKKEKRVSSKESYERMG